MSSSKTYSGSGGGGSAPSQNNKFPSNSGNKKEWETMTLEEAALKLGLGPVTKHRPSGNMKENRVNKHVFNEVIKYGQRVGFMRKAQGSLHSFHPEFFQRFSMESGDRGQGSPRAGGSSC
jgi:hypothetical protein